MICAKIGPFTNRSRRAALFFVEDLGAGDVRRHQVGRELDPLEIEIEDVGERLDQQRLGQAGHAGDQAVAAGEQRDEHLLDDLVLSDDDLAQLGENTLRVPPRLFQRCRRVQASRRNPCRVPSA
mgnify:CR=1 FL=1